jgi:hypothetical protein
VSNGKDLPEGHYAFVVMPGGEVRATKLPDDDVLTAKSSSRGVGHTSLAEERPVAMAGTFEVGPNGKVTNDSGHYHPSGPGLKEVGFDAMQRHGFDMSEAQWEQVPFKPLA